MGATKFEPKKLRMLSPDADDWNQLVLDNIRFPVQENSIYGVLLYPKTGFSKQRIDTRITDWINELDNFSHGSLDTSIVVSRDNDWAFIYQITAWYNHFDLNEEYD